MHIENKYPNINIFIYFSIAQGSVWFEESTLLNIKFRAMPKNLIILYWEKLINVLRV